MTSLTKIEPWKSFDSKAWLKDKTIIVIDDIVEMREAIRFSLKSIELIIQLKEMGKGMIEARNGKEAMKAIENKETHLIICDWDMPKMPGIKVLQAVRSHKDERIQNLPFMMVTAVDKREQILWALEEGADGYVVKPITPQKIENGIKQTLWKSNNMAGNRKIVREVKELMEGNNHEQALKICMKQVKDGSKSPSIRFWIGQVCEADREKESDAEDWYNDALRKNPMFNLSRVALSNLYIKQGKLIEALDLIDEAIVKSPGNPMWLKHKGYVLTKIDEEKKHNPANRIWDTPEGKALFKKDITSEVEKTFVQAVRKDPEIAQEIGERFLKDNDYNRAAQFFRVALDKYTSMDKDKFTREDKKECLHIYNKLGISLREEGKYQDAVKEYDKAINIDQKDPALYFNKGQAFLKWGKIPNAEKYFLTAGELNNKKETPDLVIADEIKKELKNCLAFSKGPLIK